MADSMRNRLTKRETSHLLLHQTDNVPNSAAEQGFSFPVSFVEKEVLIKELIETRDNLLVVLRLISQAAKSGLRVIARPCFVLFATSLLLQLLFAAKLVIYPEALEYTRSNLTQSDFAIFYNIYVPTDATAQKNALRIIEEQMGQIGKSYAASLSKPTKIFYVTLGARNVVNETYMNRFCGAKGKYNLECEHLEHHEDGMEVFTLERVHDYCRHPNEYGDIEPLGPPDRNHDVRRVMYLHNKGSFHPGTLNDQWRRLMTYSVTSEDCLHPPNNTCNLCGFYFIAERGLFMPGNLWTARCDYVEKLLPPQDYREEATRVMKDALMLHLQHQFDMDLFNFLEDNYGVNRFADEMWSGSHPSIVPCDLSATKKKNFGFGQGDPFFQFVTSFPDPFQTQATLKWTMAPQIPIEYDLPMVLRDGGLSGYFFFQQSKRLREFSLLGGNLYKWLKTYHEVPPPNSWIWTWFPDGEIWKAAVEEYGENAVEELTLNHKTGEIEFVDPIYRIGFTRVWNWRLIRYPLRWLGLSDWKTGTQ